MLTDQILFPVIWLKRLKYLEEVKGSDAIGGTVPQTVALGENIKRMGCRDV